MATYYAGIQDAVVEKLTRGTLKIVGGVVRDHNGLIVAYVQRVARRKAPDAMTKLAVKGGWKVISVAAAAATGGQSEVAFRVAGIFLDKAVDVFLKQREILAAVKRVERLAYLNVGLSAANLVVSAVGFAMVLNRLGEIKRHLDRLEVSLGAVDAGVAKMVDGDHRTLLSRSLFFISQARSDIPFLEHGRELPTTMYQTRRLLNEFAIHIEELAARSTRGNAIKLPLDLVFLCREAYFAVLQAYLLACHREGTLGLQGEHFVEQARSVTARCTSRALLEPIYLSLITLEDPLLTQREAMMLVELHRAQFADDLACVENQVALGEALPPDHHVWLERAMEELPDDATEVLVGVEGAYAPLQTSP